MHLSPVRSVSAAHLASLHTFFRVVERESFRAVARELGVSQPTVSRQVASLEEHLGVRLLNRTTRKVSPTDAGRALHARASDAMRTLFEAEDDVRAGESAMSGIVRIAAPGALGRHLLIPVIAEVVAENPGLSVELQLSDQRVGLVEGRVDFAVRVGPQVEASLTVRKVGVSQQVFVASRGYVRRHGRPRSLADLRDHGTVLREEGGGNLRALRAELGKVGARVVFTSDDLEAACVAVRAGLGVGLLPEWLVRDDVSARRLVRCVLDAPSIGAPVFVVRPTAGWLPRRARVVFDRTVVVLGRRLESLEDA
jgi:LysR family transcriptional regulator for bpeEF and oprC